MPIYEIHRHELAAYGDRQRKGEILITGMTLTAGGYRLQIVETSRLADAMKLPPLAPAQEPKTPVIEAKAQETATPKVMVTCHDCQTEHPEGQDCPICSPLARAAIAARARRRAYHLWKKGEGPKV